ncbi:fluoride efflux transporter CrcB [Bacillus sp. V5-8f]|uniref:fluoride efflux transporter CrcB n=1 Tax=Bacillus sp. V5-8f TaxID=2053044 RepID=UPI0027E5206E|nr:fluoride efflux transporter CrcB [Bacillus sp. V5-8f]
MSIILGGFLGSIFRFYTGEWVKHQNAGFPIGTFLINVVGCFFLGWLLTYFAKKKHMNQQIVLFLGTGFTGSFTTFSTFSVETFILVERGHVILAASYVLLSVLLGLSFAFAGKALADLLLTKHGDSA